MEGFENLAKLDVRFGPFTCIAGANGVGKSNVFDAIQFLAALAHKPLLEAALSDRGPTGVTGNARSIFFRSGDSVAETMRLAAEMP